MMANIAGPPDSPTDCGGNSGSAGFDPAAITRPDPSLLTYYALVSALTLIGFPLVFAAAYCKYRTLTYRFDDRGVSMSWGLLFKREIYLTYRRIQDIHVTRNLFHRWLGLAAVAVQTASGAAGAEMTIEGITHPERLRDFLYEQMRGARDTRNDANEPRASASGLGGSVDPGGSGGPLPHGRGSSEDEALALLREIRDGIRGLRELRSPRTGGPSEPSS